MTGKTLEATGDCGVGLHRIPRSTDISFGADLRKLTGRTRTWMPCSATQRKHDEETRKTDYFHINPLSELRSGALVKLIKFVKLERWVRKVA